MTLEDLANYKVIERDPVCIEYRGKNVCGMGPPSSGALAVGQILGILKNFDISAIGDPLDVQAVHLFTQANRLAFANCGKYVGDSDFVDVPVAGMLNKTYLQSRAALINETGSDMGVAEPGIPPGVASQESGADTGAKTTGTSHVSIVDCYGNSLSMTTTVESPYGNGVMVKGFLINNQLTDFSFASNDADGNPIANRVQPNKRPRSSMSPSIVFDENGLPELLTGSPGGSSIIVYTAQSIYNVYDFGLNPQEAINVPHYQNNNAIVTSLEVPKPGVTIEYNITELTEELEARGHGVAEADLTSGLSVIIISEDDTMAGGADGRREGTVGGSDSVDGGDQVSSNMPTSMPTTKPEDAGSSKLSVVASALTMLFALLLLSV
jgi:gamma-glutamyltranspeptidase/glutathione hydrolase